jgi:hypothetical protein
MARGKRSRASSLRSAVQRQTPVKGGRVPIGAGVIGEIRREVERLAARYGVSRSFVVAVALADQFGIEVERYEVRRRGEAG